MLYLFEALAEIFAFARYVFHESGFAYLLAYGVTHRARERRGTESRPVIAGRPRFGDFVGSEARRYREAAAYAFSRAHDVGFYTVMLESPELARSSRARLHFVEYEKLSVLLRKLSCELHIRFRSGHYAALALNGLYEQCRDLFVVERLRERFLVVVRNVYAYSAGKRRERLIVLLLPRGGHGSDRPSVEGLLRSHYLIFVLAALVKIFARKFNTAFVGFRAAVAEKDFTEIGTLYELFRHKSARLGIEIVGYDGDLFRLLDERVGKYRVIITQCVHRDTREKIEVSFTFGIGEITAFAFYESYVHRRISIHEILFVAFFDNVEIAH